jgi:hypothetical protein
VIGPKENEIKFKFSAVVGHLAHNWVDYINKMPREGILNINFDRISMPSHIIGQYMGPSVSQIDIMKEIKRFRDLNRSTEETANETDERMVMEKFSHEKYFIRHVEFKLEPFYAILFSDKQFELLCNAEWSTIWVIDSTYKMCKDSEWKLTTIMVLNSRYLYLLSGFFVFILFFHRLESQEL